ncbi:trypsin-like peptidase domain-containing protein [Streptomyces sp. VRA16 Mangrove soil]|uniref:trypsin-like peptidase domain-containing protein n=1 Tax=Streptomyces sp. VRA16 Mangrove soil TaxID=2817434 RepID=UPI001A9F67FE|nr:trypsin-like peptidase domain-containing protein [Streptomyces sp. VRA16 Mangrove soil]MBO1333730.1 bifunctional trypsin-like peptidase domain-containing/SEL1-like repeat protein [Streptomyces sp. VRA16 Mangrove soil]
MSIGLEARRAAEVIVSGDDGKGRRGSGYLVAVGRVLTAAHVVRGAHTVTVRFDADLATERVHRAGVLWEDQAIDVAVLAVDGDQQSVSWTHFGSVPNRDVVLRCSAVGFPGFKMRTDPDGSRYRDSCHVHGSCAVWSNRREGTLDLRVAASPTKAAAGESPWDGMSGAAVFSGASLIGIVGHHHLSDGSDHLAVLRVDGWHSRLSPEAARRLEDAIGVPLRPSRLIEVRAEFESTGTNKGGPPLGRRLSSLPPEHALALEVHPAIELREPGQRLEVLPPYLQRDGVDDELRKVVADAENGSKLLMLVGGSSTGKTRAAWESVRACLSGGWRLWHPLAPERPVSVLEALSSGRVAPRTVLWLNETQLYLTPSPYGERVAAVLHELLADGRAGPLLVLGSLWPRYWDALTKEPEKGGSAPDPHAAARSLLGLATVVHVPESFSEYELLGHKQVLDADPRLAQAADAAGGRVTQFLAGAPELVRRYKQASAAARAVLLAAMDARRLGHGALLPRAFLERAAPGYLSDDEWDVLEEDWFDRALTYLAEPCRGARGPLSQSRPRPGSADADGRRGYRLADYLEQHGSAERWHISPPADFWEAAAHAATPQDTSMLARAARQRWRLRHAARLYQQAAAQQDVEALEGVALLCNHTGNRSENLNADDVADTGGVTAAESDIRWSLRQSAVRERLAERHEAAWLEQREEGEFVLPWERGETADARLWREMAPLREAAPHMGATEELMTEAVAEGNSRLLFSLALIRELAGDRYGAEAALRQAARAGHPRALIDLARLRELAGDRESAGRYALDAAAHGHTGLLTSLVEHREQHDLRSARRLAHRAADAGHADILMALAIRRTLAEGLGSPWVRLWRYGLTAEGDISRPW